MDATEIFVIVAALAAIAATNWYFLFSEPGGAAATTHGGVQRVRIRVEGGYDPSVIRVNPGPVKLVFDRQERSGCSEEVVIPSIGLRRFLPPFAETEIDFVAEAGVSEYEFTCGMSMLRGKVIVEEGQDEQAR